MSVELIRQALEEDLGDHGDITSQAIFTGSEEFSAIITAREDGVLSGISLAQQTFEIVDPNLSITLHKKDGEDFIAQDKILSVAGKTLSILKAERTVLNFLSHLSGIATQTAHYIEAVKGTNAQIYDTRKTLPAYRALHKQAVRDGGGNNHRFGLYDAILIKDNHIAAAGNITRALEACKGKSNFIQIEVDNLEQLKEVCQSNIPHAVLLDNMNPETLEKAIRLVDGKFLTEASGGIILENIRKIAETGVDRISIGALTHTVKPIDFGLDQKI